MFQLLDEALVPRFQAEMGFEQKTAIKNLLSYTSIPAASSSDNPHHHTSLTLSIYQT
jgi:hypothetical protein